MRIGAFARMAAVAISGAAFLETSFVNALGSLIENLLYIFVFVVLAGLVLRAYKQEKIKFSEFVFSWRSFWAYIVIALLLIVITMCGSIVALYPASVIYYYYTIASAPVSGIILAVNIVAGLLVALCVLFTMNVFTRYSFSFYAVIDKQLSISKALSYSSHLTFGARWKLLWYVMAVFIVSFMVGAYTEHALQEQSINGFCVFLNICFGMLLTFAALIDVSLYKQLEKVS